jgi:hypothetical protein
MTVLHGFRGFNAARARLMRAFIDTGLWAYRLDGRERAKSLRVGHWLAASTAEHEVVISTGC